MAAIVGSVNGVPFSKIWTSCPIQIIAASVNWFRSRARSKSRYPGPEVGNAMSDSASSGTRTSSRNRCPSGFTNARTVTSPGMSWADCWAGNASTSPSTIASNAIRLPGRMKCRIVFVGIVACLIVGNR